MGPGEGEDEVHLARVGWRFYSNAKGKAAKKSTKTNTHAIPGTHTAIQNQTKPTLNEYVFVGHARTASAIRAAHHV